jgi:hypothetical protein
LFCTGSLKIVQPPVGFDVLLTAMSRWLLPFVVAVVPTWSSVRTTTKNRCVVWSNRQTGSVIDGPRLVGRLDGELVPAVREPLVEQVQALEVRAELGVRLRFLARAHRRALAGLGSGKRPVDATLLVVAAP